MFVVRYLTRLALVVWIGGMILLGAIVAPSTFGVLQATDPVNGRVLAGAVFGDVLRHFHLVAYGCGLALAAGLIVMKLVGPPPRAFPVRLAIVAAMLAVAVYSGVPVTREIESLQATVQGPIAALPATDARRVRFDRLHATSTTLMTINLALGLVLLYWDARD